MTDPDYIAVDSLSLMKGLFVLLGSCFARLILSGSPQAVTLNESKFDQLQMQQ